MYNIIYITRPVTIINESSDRGHSLQSQLFEMIAVIVQFKF